MAQTNENLNKVMEVLTEGFKTAREFYDYQTEFNQQLDAKVDRVEEKVNFLASGFKVLTERHMELQKTVGRFEKSLERLDGIEKSL